MKYMSIKSASAMTALITIITIDIRLARLKGILNRELMIPDVIKNTIGIVIRNTVFLPFRELVLKIETEAMRSNLLIMSTRNIVI